MKKRMIITLVSLALLGTTVGVFVTLRHYREQAHRKDCIVNIKNGMIFSVMSYAADHDHSLPDSLLDVVHEQYILPNSAWVCPASGKDVPKTVSDIKNGQCDYVYLGKGLKDTMPNPDKTVIIYEVEENHGGRWISVGFGDWHVDGVDARTISEAAQRYGWIIPTPKKSTTEQVGPAPAGD